MATLSTQRLNPQFLEGDGPFLGAVGAPRGDAGG